MKKELKDQELVSYLKNKQFFHHLSHYFLKSKGEYNKHFEKGVYHCVACDAPLYKSETKFDSGCGWPAFFQAIDGALDIQEDSSLGMVRTEIMCKNCGGHLGHIFKVFIFFFLSF